MYGQKKSLFFPEMQVTRKIFTQTVTNLFKSNFWRYYLFYISFLCFIWFLFLFVCLIFLKLKMYILIHIWLCGQVSDKKIFIQLIFRNKTTFFFGLRELKFSGNMYSSYTERLASAKVEKSFHYREMMRK